jgi:hypothetical protein
MDVPHGGARLEAANPELGVGLRNVDGRAQVNLVARRNHSRHDDLHKNEMAILYVSQFYLINL